VERRSTPDDLYQDDKTPLQSGLVIVLWKRRYLSSARSVGWRAYWQHLKVLENPDGYDTGCNQSAEKPR
jgi:hypothetical protein